MTPRFHTFPFLGPVPCQGCRRKVIWNGKGWHEWVGDRPYILKKRRWRNYVHLCPAYTPEQRVVIHDLRRAIA